MFLINSRLGLFTATPGAVRRMAMDAKGYPFSLSYGANLPSSLTMVLSFTWGLLPLPTCVGLRYGHPYPITTRLFLAV